ncbi:MAG: hypothetical protein PHQ44_07365 [Anaerovibrio sp.]|nr:hypothetical protein [Anaerovibrio sp.]
MENKEYPVRVMTHEEKAEYDDITVEECAQEDGKSQESGSERPDSFDEVYEDNSRRQDFRQNFRSYGGGSKIYTFGAGRHMSAWQKWRYRLIAGLVVLAVLWFLVFVALPVAAVGVVAAMIAYLLYSFFS